MLAIEDMSIEDMIRQLNPKIIGMRNYYNRRFAQRKLAQIDHHIIKKFTKWYNLKRQRQYRLGKMKEFRELVYSVGLARMRVLAEC
ncbi:MAG: group II intron maturase-specific domain-containing protein [Desulfosporosinus sp.]